MKRHNKFSWFACLFGFSILAHAQAVPTATRAGGLQVGAGISYVKPDYGTASDKGITVYGTFDFTQHIGIEGDVHYTSIIAPADLGENTYLLGPRYVYRRGRFAPYAKGLLGLGAISYQFDNRPHHTDYYKMYAFGGGLDIKATHRLNVRAFDFEYQKWPTFYPHTLSPIVMTVGVAYSFR